MKKILFSTAMAICFSLPAWATKLECRTHKSKNNLTPYYQGFQFESENGKLLMSRFQDTYGDWQTVGSDRDTQITESKSKSGATHVEIEYTPGHDMFYANLDLVVGTSPYVEESFIDCLGNSSVISSVSCQIVSEFSK